MISFLVISSLYLFHSSLSPTVFSVYIAAGNKLDLGIAYSVMTVFNIIKQPLRLLPMFIGMAVEILVSISRIQKFLECDEIEPRIKKLTAGESTDNAVTINDAYFSWGFKEKETKIDPKEAKKEAKLKKKRS